MDNKIRIYTDGACIGNPGPGGWGVLLRYGKHQKKLKGGEPDTTNNRMELMAAIMGLKALKRPCQVMLYTDSQYLRKGITEWVMLWKKKGWKTRENQPVKNQDLWQMLDQEAQRHQIEWHWVKAHNGHHENEMVDALARKAALVFIKKKGKLN